MGYTDPERQKEYQRRWMNERRTAWIQEQGGKCVQCGSTDRIEIDHVDPSQKAMNPTSLWSLKAQSRQKELDKCQLLCHDCHALKTYVRRVAEHGTRLSYMRDRCRCEPCKTWNRERVRVQRANEYQRRNPVQERKAA